MKKFLIVFLIVGVFIGLGIFLARTDAGKVVVFDVASFLRRQLGAIGDVFVDLFTRVEVLEETGAPSESASRAWWLNSSGLFYVENGIGSTIQGELPTSSRWYGEYARANPLDTDGGAHPQNIFRLVSRSVWNNFRQEAYFRVTRDNVSASPNRNASNGLLLFNRYFDGDNLYYTGLRVDGYAVIKKKKNGTYYTMDYKPFLPGSGSYSRDTNPSLLPKNTWIGLRSEVLTNASGTVSVKLWIDNGKTGNWVLGAEAVDDGTRWGGAPITGAASVGLRTDFMDVQFSDYRVEEVDPNTGTVIATGTSTTPSAPPAPGAPAEPLPTSTASSTIIAPPADTEPPVITLKGSDPIEIEQGQPFVDPGVTVRDNVDTELPVTVLNGNIDTNQIGIYVITYTTRDSAGNIANPVTRNVVVKAVAVAATTTTPLAPPSVPATTTTTTTPLAPPAPAPSSPVTAPPAPGAPGCASIAANTDFYIDPLLQAARVERDLRNLGQTADADLLKEISCEPQGIWLVGNISATSIGQRVANVMQSAAHAARIPVFVIYNIPSHTSLTWHSGVGDPSAYRVWISAIANNIGSREAWVILEPDAIGLSFQYSAADRDARLAELRGAVSLLKAGAPNARVYLDAGHSAWRPISQTVPALQKAGIDLADGFATNISNFNFTANEIAYGTNISNLVGGKHFLIDTSRNGLGPSPTREWCNPRGRALGHIPTRQTGNPLVDALAWIKVPGESDGTCNGGPTPGRFWLEYALELIRNARAAGSLYAPLPQSLEGSGTGGVTTIPVAGGATSTTPVLGFSPTSTPQVGGSAGTATSSPQTGGLPQTATSPATSTPTSTPASGSRATSTSTGGSQAGTGSSPAGGGGSQSGGSGSATTSATSSPSVLVGQGSAASGVSSGSGNAPTSTASAHGAGRPTSTQSTSTPSASQSVGASAPDNYGEIVSGGAAGQASLQGGGGGGSSGGGPSPVSYGSLSSGGGGGGARVGYESRPLSSGGTASGGGGIRLPEGISLQASQGAGFVVPAKYAPALIVTRPLAQGSRSEEVRALQEVLARDKSIYPEGIVSGYFGPLTTRAIQVFQRRHGIISFGDSESTGYGVLGPRTLAKLNEIYGTARESGGGGGAAGGLIKKSEPPIFAEAPRQGIVSPVDSPARRALVEAIRAELAVIAEKARKLIEQAAALFGSPR